VLEIIGAVGTCAFMLYIGVAVATHAPGRLVAMTWTDATSPHTREFVEQLAPRGRLSGVAEVPIRLTAGQWATVDATMDNAAQSAVDTYYSDPEPALAVRQAGWDQVPWVGERREWPPMDQVLTIRLRREQWQLALDALAHDDPIYERLGDQESLRLGREAHAAITRQLR
jgi:hypothetical protein